jgi:hypothetical protein
MQDTKTEWPTPASPFPTFLDLSAPFCTFSVHFHTQAEQSLKPVIEKQQETD